MPNDRFPGDRLDLDALSMGLPKSVLDQPFEADSISKALKDHAGLGPSAEEALRAIDDQQAALGKGIFDRLSGAGLASSAFERLGHALPRGAGDHFSEMGAARRALDDLAGPGSAFGDIQRQIDEQRAAISALRSPAHESLADRYFNEPIDQVDFHIPENPLHETNDRLANIEGQFDRAQEIAANAASIATSLQQAALQFLEKFEAAARGNARAARRAIWIGAIAVMIAVAMPVIQVVYTEFWRAPADATAGQAALRELKGEVEALRAGQRDMADRLATALERRDASASAILGEIRDLLAKSVHQDGSAMQ